ncbi:MAG: 3-mercaptopyruvate sulfurtransferase [Alphaproteobacteria bacterium]|nr:3-mercaptopyruvate sulfurtransferase [Alphaproteobacteria bacterium]
MDHAHFGYLRPEALVSTSWLEAHLQDPAVQILDGTFFLPVQQRNAKEEYHDCHITGAVPFDIDEVSDSTSGLPHMLPSPERFAEMVGKMGIGNDVHVVVYDASGMTSAAARVWWMFRIFGHDKVSVLNGGLPKWLREGRSVEENAGPPATLPRQFTPYFRPHLVRGLADVRENLSSKLEQMVDARPLPRFKGETPEPRPVLKQGHIPGSLPMPFPVFFDKKDGVMKNADELKQAFAEAGIDLGKPLLSTCGSGVTACVPALAAFLLGYEDVAVYDGSWAEWGNLQDAPAELG